MQVVLYLCLLVLWCGAYKPVFMMHGINDSENEWSSFAAYVQTAHPGTQTIAIPLFDHDSSFLPLWEQAHGISKYIRQRVEANATTFANGYHLVCHSQGALICRAVLQVMDDHAVDTFISLAGPQLGEYGPYEFLNTTLGNLSLPDLWRVLYTPLLQHSLSIANFWNDPHVRPHYLSGNVFLPVLNNERNANATDAARMKANFLRTRRMAFFGSPADNQILPWQSSLFGFYNGSSHTQPKPIEQQVVFVADLFGLATLNATGRLQLSSVEGVGHTQWVRRKDIFETYLQQLLV
eukprot:TRINITY_DN20579_c0_g1_i1.p1 TRINITY_DN20579_c0_g1~~TRINITY_DN20579_c0_g1_i1.p1  ORF type:complete len:300 (-),score=45.20 TRINITY_DN20579_c0_g1_i1:104-982(-)